MQNNEPKTGDPFVEQLSDYQSANSDNESLKKNFVVRRAEFELIVDDLRRKQANDPLQHELILGRRGSGKSTLLKRIQIEIEEDSELSTHYIAINLAEEQAGIYRLSDLWFEVWRELRNQLNPNAVLRNFSDFEDNTAYTRYLYTEIHELLSEGRKKAVVLLDNLDRILENLDDDGHLLRETLLNYSDLQLIGGSTRMDEHFWEYDKPFYEFFRRHRLEALTFDEINLLLNHWSVAMNLPQLYDYAPKNSGKIEAIRILTDGLPRTLQFFIQILLHESDLYGFAYIRRVMDKLTPLYQDRLNNLTPPQRKIVLEMAFLWEACSTKQLVEQCRMESKLISSFIKQLAGFGIAETIATGNKNNLYRLSERFFNMWLIITQGNPEQKRKAMWLTIFLESWYDAADLKNLAQAYKQKLKEGGVAYDKANVLTKAFSQSKYITTFDRDELIDLTAKLSKKDAGMSQVLPKKFKEIYKEIIELINAEKYEVALEKVNEIENEEDGVKFALKGYIYAELNKSEEAEKYYLLAIEKGHAGALFNLALLYDNQEKLQEAEHYYLLAIEKENTNALFNLANLYNEQKKPQEAEKYYLLAIEKGHAGALFNLANLYHRKEKPQQAEKYYLLAIEKGNINALNNLAVLYRQQGKPQEAEKYYLLAIEKGHAGALFNLAKLYDNQEKPQEAEKYYLLAIGKGHTSALNNLALLYDNQEKLQEAEHYYLLAIEKENTNALFNLALLYHRQEKLQEAEKYYLLAIEKGDINVLNNLANLYENQGKLQEAEKYYLLAIEKGDTNAFNNLANLYHEQEKPQKAERYYLLAIEKGDTDALFNMANLYREQEKLQEAEKYYLLAIEKGDTNAFNNLANLYREQEKLQEAEKYYLLAIEKENTNVLFNLALFYYEDKLEKKMALQYITEFQQHQKDKDSSELALVISIWNNLFENVEAKINELFLLYGYEEMDWLIENLLYLEQKQLVLSLFESEQHGKPLRDRYTLLYYATLFLTNKVENNLELRIPPEVQPTVQEIIEKVKEKNAFYAQ